MRLPWGQIEPMRNLFLKDRNLELFGCLSFEGRCCAVPERLYHKESTKIHLLKITDPEEAFPNFEKEIDEKVEANRKRLEEADIKYEKTPFELLASEDELLAVLDSWNRAHEHNAVVVLDITALPKRFFCFILKRFLLIDTFSDVVVTYTYPAPNGYTTEHLAEDPMTCDHLPGFSAPLPPKGDTLVVSIGYESLSIRSLLEIYNDRKRAIKIILPFPPNGKSTNRLWQTVREIGIEPQEIRGNIESIASWDAEEVYHKLKQWHDNSDGLTLAPFGPKTHSLGMTLFALEYDSGLYYTQPKSYNPEYSKGESETWAYVVKWQGVPCYKRYISSA